MSVNPKFGPSPCADAGRTAVAFVRGEPVVAPRLVPPGEQGGDPLGEDAARFVLANSAEVGLRESRLPFLGALKAAGAAGLLLGLVGVPFVGIAAAAGLVLFFVGAVAAHVRARVFHNFAFPGGYLALAVASLVLSAAR